MLRRGEPVFVRGDSALSPKMPMRKARSLDTRSLKALQQLSARWRHAILAPSKGATHYFCTGVQGTCEAYANAPADLAAPGFKITAGQQHQVTFTTPGVYKLTCTVHPMMNVQVVVK